MSIATGTVEDCQSSVYCIYSNDVDVVVVDDVDDDVDDDEEEEDDMYGLTVVLVVL